MTAPVSTPSLLERTRNALFDRRPPALRVDYTETTRLFEGPWRKFGLMASVLFALLAPMDLGEVLGFNFPFSGMLSEYRPTLAGISIAIVGALGLNILTGLTGQVSLGHGAFLAVGAYVSAYFTINQGWPYLLTILVSGVVAMAIGAAIGPVAFRLKGLYLSIVTLGLIFLVQQVLFSWDAVTDGANGLRFSAAEERPNLFGFTLDPGPAETEVLGQAVDKHWRYYYLALIFVAIGMWVAKNIQRSRSGRAMQAVRDRDIAAETIGVNVRQVKLSAFMVSSFYAGVAGALHAAWTSAIQPDTYGLAVSIEYVAMVVIGGIGTVFGSVVGAIFVVGLPTLVEQILDTFAGQTEIGPFGDTGIKFDKTTISGVLYGITLIIFLISEPLGLYGIWLRIRAYFSAWPFKY